MLPFDITESITGQKTYVFDKFFAGNPAYYVRIEASEDCDLLITQIDGGSFTYNRGIRRYVPLELVSYKIKSIVIYTPASTATTIYIHATSQEQEACQYVSETK